MVERIGSETIEEAHEAHTMEFANLAMSSQARGDHQVARQAWLDALAYAEQHLPGNKVVLWIRSGLGDSLLKNGDYHGALKMAGSVLQFCASVKAPLAALTMAKAYLRLGDLTHARQYAQQACDLKSDTVLMQFSIDDQQALGMTAPS